MFIRSATQSIASPLNLSKHEQKLQPVWENIQLVQPSKMQFKSKTQCQSWVKKHNSCEKGRRQCVVQGIQTEALLFSAWSFA